MMLLAIGIEHALDVTVQCPHDDERIPNQFLKRDLVVLAKCRSYVSSNRKMEA
jgi:hypothetical protein